MHHIPDPESILKPFFRSDDIRVPLQRLNASLPSGAGLWIIGGAPRNAIIEFIHGESPLTEDIDVFLANVDPDLSLPGLDLGGELRPTELGGIRWISDLSPYSFDIGLLPKFVIIEKFRLDPTPRSLLSAIDFDVNAIMWDWARQQALASGCVEAAARKVMDFNTTFVFDKLLLAYRILLIHHKTGFSLSKNIFDYIKTAVDLETLKKLKTTLVSKLGKRTGREIMKSCDGICLCRSYEEHLAGMVKDINP